MKKKECSTTYRPRRADSERAPFCWPDWWDFSFRPRSLVENTQKTRNVHQRTISCRITSFYLSLSLFSLSLSLSLSPLSLSLLFLDDDDDDDDDICNNVREEEQTSHIYDDERERERERSQQQKVDRRLQSYTLRQLNLRHFLITSSSSDHSIIYKERVKNGTLRTPNG